MMFFKSILPMILAVTSFFSLHGDGKPLPEKIVQIMQQPKYQHSFWGLYAKDLETGEVLYDLNSNKMFLPASTTKLFSVSALLNAYGDNYRYKTPVYAVGAIENGRFNGDLILVGKGDLTFGGRQGKTDEIAFTDLDHTIANSVPGVVLTPEDPLEGLKELARQVKSKGIKEINGDVLVDDRLFEKNVKRESLLSPIMINENLIDIVINPTEINKEAAMTWRPHVTGYNVTSAVKTVSKDEPLDLKISADAEERNIVITGNIPIGQKDIVRTFAVEDPVSFARAAFIDALKDAGVVVNISKGKNAELPSESALQKLDPIAVFTSPPLSEYAKLILKVSHNLGANLIPMLLAVKNGEKSFDSGLKLIGDFVVNQVKIAPDAFVIVDGAGGNDNRFTPQAEVQLLSYMKKMPAKQFQSFYDALPILGVDGSLAPFEKNSPAAGKARAKTGTGVTFNPATNQLFLNTQVLSGYVEGKNGHWIAYMLAVNNATMPTIEDIIPIFDDESKITTAIYEESK